MLSTDTERVSPRVVLISPVRDEAETLPRTAQCVLSQTLRPAQWILVNDGSRDRSAEIAEELAAAHPWITVVHRPDRGFRKVGGGVIEAFNAGRDSLSCAYDFIAKMDVDLEFGPEYLERAMELFSEDRELAALSGKVFRQEGDDLVEEFMIDEMVAGQFKLYRQECFDAIGGFVREVMWDGIDFHRCRMQGFKTRSVNDPALRILHLRLMGSSDKSVYRGRLRWGRGQWFLGSAFPYVLASGVFRVREKPYIVGGALIVLGYLRAALQREPRYEFPGFRQNLREWQNRRLASWLKGKGAR